MRKPRHMARHAAFALLVSGALALGACSKEEKAADGTTTAAAPVAKSLPDALDNADGLQTVAEGLKTTGIKGVFDGKGSYTLLAPEDAAFAKLGEEQSKALTAGEDHAALAALLKDHILPGYITPKDIETAIAANQGAVKMHTVAGTALTFTKEGTGIAVTAPDGTKAMIDGEPLAGGSSVAIPLDTVLKKI